MDVHGGLSLPLFVLTCDAPLPDRAFFGYAFDGTDLIVGNTGHDAFEAARGRPVALDQDGCHALLRAGRDGHVLSTDIRGHCRLFVYRRGRLWAVSNSFALLVDAVRARDWPITPLGWVLDGWTLRTRSLDQPAFAQTAVAEIRFLYQGERLLLSPGGARVLPAARLGGDVADAETALRRTVAQWVSRLATVASCGAINPRIELSGGLDSRVVLALLLFLRDRVSLPEAGRVAVISNRASATDFAVAGAVAGRFGLDLNPQVPLHRMHRRDDAQRWNGWRAYSLGMYRPPYPPPAFHDPACWTFSGHAGERLRVSGEPPELISTLKDRRGMFATGLGYRRMSMAVRGAKRWASQICDLPMSVDWCYQMAFRVRQHGGYLMQIEGRFSPLTGAGFDGCLAGMSLQDIRRDTVHHRMMAMLAPGLAELPYDDPVKGRWVLPKGEVAALSPAGIGPGAVFGATEPELHANLSAQTVGNADAGLLSRLETAYADARPLADRALRREVVAAADAAMTTAAAAAALPARRPMQAVHAVLLAGLVGVPRLRWLRG